MISLKKLFLSELSLSGYFPNFLLTKYPHFKTCACHSVHYEGHILVLSSVLNLRVSVPGTVLWATVWAGT